MTPMTDVRVLIVDKDDLSTIIHLYTSCLEIPALVCKTTPETEADQQMIIKWCKLQETTHLIFTSLGVQNKTHYPARITFLKTLCSKVRKEYPKIQIILITGAEPKDIPEAEKIFDRIIFIDLGSFERITKFIKGLKRK